MSEIILHIGWEKTGTTSIQAFLDDHKTVLARHGMAVAGCLGWRNHKLLAAFGMNAGSRDIAVTSAGIDGPESHLAFRERTRGHVIAEIARSAAQAYVISSEDLSRLASCEEVSRIHALLAPLCDRIRVVAFVRRQDLLAVSRYYSHLVNGVVLPAVLPVPELAGYYDYGHRIGIWADVFGADAIRIVHYPESGAGNGFDAVDAFCQAAGIALGADRPRVATRENVSLDVIGQVMLEAINRQSGILRDHRLRKRLIEVLHTGQAAAPGRLVSAAQARAFYAHFADANARLFAQFGLPPDFFADDFSMYPENPVERAALAQPALHRMAGVVASLVAMR